MSVSEVKASRAFKRNFDTVAKHYGCTPEEIELMKEAARRDMPGAERSFAAMMLDIEELERIGS